MVECSICGRGGAITGSPMRYCQGYAVRAACWDGIALAVLTLATERSAQGGPQLKAEHVNAQECSAVIADLLGSVAQRVRRGG